MAKGCALDDFNAHILTVIAFFLNKKHVASKFFPSQCNKDLIKFPEGYKTTILIGLTYLLGQNSTAWT